MESTHRDLVATVRHRPTGFGLVGDAKIFSDALVALGYTRPAVKVARVKIPKVYRVLLSITRRMGLLEAWKRIERKVGFRKKRSIMLHLEDIDILGLHRSGLHILVPNQEWFDVEALDVLPLIDEVWCKTRIAESIFSELGCTTRYIGFRSEADLGQQTSMRDAYVFSRVGNSSTRGVSTLVEAWRRNPRWPTLKIIVHPSKRVWPQPHNVEYLDIFSDNIEYLSLASNSLYHIYLTECEGFGHSIVEALGYGALVVTTDAPPMNELVDESCGILVSSNYCGQRRLSPRFSSKEEDVIEAVDCALALPRERVNSLTENGKRRYKELSEQFPLRLQGAIEKLIGSNS